MDLARQISIITFIEMKKSFFLFSSAIYVFKNFYVPKCILCLDLESNLF